MEIVEACSTYLLFIDEVTAKEPPQEGLYENLDICILGKEYTEDSKACDDDEVKNACFAALFKVFSCLFCRFYLIYIYRKAKEKEKKYTILLSFISSRETKSDSYWFLLWARLASKSLMVFSISSISSDNCLI